MLVDSARRLQNVNIFRTYANFDIHIKLNYVELQLGVFNIVNLLTINYFHKLIY